ADPRRIDPRLASKPLHRTRDVLVSLGPEPPPSSPGGLAPARARAPWIAAEDDDSRVREDLLPDLRSAPAIGDRRRSRAGIGQKPHRPLSGRVEVRRPREARLELDAVAEAERRELDGRPLPEVEITRGLRVEPADVGSTRSAERRARR